MLDLIHGYSGIHVACGPWVGHSWNLCTGDRGPEKEQVFLCICVSDTGAEPEILPRNIAVDVFLTSHDTMKMDPQWSPPPPILEWYLSQDNRMGELRCFTLKVWTAYLVGSFKISHDHLDLISPGKVKGREVSHHWGRCSEVTKG